jgi:hypothetical protein
MVSSTTLTLAAALACLVLTNQVAGDTPPPDELRYNGNNGDNGQQTSDADTNVITDDNTRPSDQRPFGNSDFSQQQQQYPQQQQQQRPGGFPFPLLAPLQPFRDLLHDALGLAPPPAFPMQRPFSPFDNIFNDMRSRHDQTFKMFDNVVRDLERQAAEGQEVSFFKVNGKAYKKTCTVERLDRPKGQQSNQLPQVLPVDQTSQADQPNQANQENQMNQMNQMNQQQQPQQPPQTRDDSSDASINVRDKTSQSS